MAAESHATPSTYHPVMAAPQSDAPWERVYTVTDYYDGPRAGVADFAGVPHVYAAIFRDDLGEWDPDDRYELSPLAPDLLPYVLEYWGIWRRFELALKSGQIVAPPSESDWGALPVDRARKVELRNRLAGALTIDPARRTVARAEFRPAGEGPEYPLGVMKDLEVRWQR